MGMGGVTPASQPRRLGRCLSNARGPLAPAPPLRSAQGRAAGQPLCRCLSLLTLPASRESCGGRAERGGVRRG